MKNTDILVDLLMEDIENKTVLEAACGAADCCKYTFSNHGCVQNGLCR